jgi:hypothetical protein
MLDSRIFDAALVYRNEGGDEPARAGRIELPKHPAKGFAAPRDAALASLAFARRYPIGSHRGFRTTKTPK